MKFKTNLKRFLSMSRQTGGFTLVELIVVIAILAILAGVAIPAYSGYITKANEAADQQLLSAINRAFAATCIQNGYGAEAVTDAEYDIDNHELDMVKVGSANLTAAELADFNADYAVYFAGNESSTFKVFTALDYIVADRNFVGLTGTVKVTFGGVEFYISQEAANKLANSTFGEIGAAGLLDKVDTVTGLAAELAAIPGSYVGQALANSMLGLAEDMDIDLEAPGGQEAFEEVMQQMIKDKVALNGGDANNSDDWNKASSEILANYAVLQAAKTQSTSGKTTDELLGELQAGVGAEEIKSLLKGEDTETTQEGINKTAMLYAMYTAYANQLPEGADKDAALEATKTPGGFVANMNDDGFMAYLNGETGNAAADLEGYLGALDIINQSAAGSTDATMDLLLNGYKDPELESALAGILGKP